MIEQYQKHVLERQKESLPPLPLNAEQTSALITLLKEGKPDSSEQLITLFKERVPSGVDQAAYIKAAYLTAIAKNEEVSAFISNNDAIELLGTMVGGYNVQSLIALLDSPMADKAADVLTSCTLIFDAFHDVIEKCNQGNKSALKLMTAWSNGEWFLRREALSQEIHAIVFKVDGETNTDDLSPAQDAWSRPDIPLHAKAMLINKMPDALNKIEALKAKGLPIAYVGDVVGTGSSRKSAINSLQWHTGQYIPFIPNKKTGGIILGNKIAPIFFNTAEDSGALPIECDVSQIKMGDEIFIRPFDGVILNKEKNK